MPFNQQDTASYRRDVSTKGQTLSIDERSELLARYLPSPDSVGKRQPAPVKQSRGHRRRVRPFLRQTLFFLIYWSIQLLFGIYLRLRQISAAIFQKYLAIRHYHHRTPAYIQKDLKNLSRLPEHLSVLLKYDPAADDGLETILDEVAELAAWSASAGIPLLSVYEKSGIMKQYMSALQEIVQQKLVLYFGRGDAAPSLQISAPNLPVLSSAAASPQLRPNGNTNGTLSPAPRQHLNLLLLSQVDGRDTMVDLTRTLTEMSQSRKLRPRDITVDLIDAEIQATTSVTPPSSVSSQPANTNGHNSPSETSEQHTPPTEPDLLIVFAPYLKLDGYPPWQIRLTEIFCVGDSGGDVSSSGRTRVEYQGFLRALWNFAGAQFRFGS